MHSKRHKNMKIGQRKRSYVSKKYNKNRNIYKNGSSRYRKHTKTGGAFIFNIFRTNNTISFFSLSII